MRPLKSTLVQAQIHRGPHGAPTEGGVGGRAERLAESLWAAAPRLKRRRDRTQRVRVFYGALLEVVFTVAKMRACRPCAQATIHTTGELVRHQLGLSLGSYYRYLEDLHALGLVDYRGHVSARTVGGRRVAAADGTLLALSLTPGHRARLGRDDFGGHRDLDRDIQEGKTAWNYLRKLERSVQAPGKPDTTPLVLWALNPGNPQKAPLEVTFPLSGPPLELLLDVPGVCGAARADAIARAATAIATTIGDLHSHRFWCKVQWRLLGTGRDPEALRYRFRVLHDLIGRTAVDAREGFARNPGRLAVSRLQKWEAWRLIGQPQARMPTRAAEAATPPNTPFSEPPVTIRVSPRAGNRGPTSPLRGSRPTGAGSR